MSILEKIRGIKGDKRLITAAAVLGFTGLLLIMLSSLFPEKSKSDTVPVRETADLSQAESYCAETEKRLEEFLSNIKGAGRVRVYLRIGSNERYVYATEGRRSETDSKTEKEEKYVIIGSGSEKNALIETIRVPVIEGAVIVCTGAAAPTVREQIYKAAAAALSLPTGKIYVAEG